MKVMRNLGFFYQIMHLTCCIAFIFSPCLIFFRNIKWNCCRIFTNATFQCSSLNAGVGVYCDCKNLIFTFYLNFFLFTSFGKKYPCMNNNSYLKLEIEATSSLMFFYFRKWCFIIVI